MIYSYVVKRFEDGAWSGVPRFDNLIRRTLPGLQSVTSCPSDLRAGDVVITDNHLSLDIPEEIRTVVVHHGSAAVHFARDPYWQTDRTAEIARLQDAMLKLKNREYVAPSAWVAEAFTEWHNAVGYRATIIPHSVERIHRKQRSGSKPIIIGDWRDWNKGVAAFKELRNRKSSDWEFRPLSFQTDAERVKQYGEASLYLCLSLSEGGSFSLCDAEAAELPIVTTNVGNFKEFDDAEVIDWRKRDDPDLVIEAIERKLREGRSKPSFYEQYTFEVFRKLWEAVIYG